MPAINQTCRVLPIIKQISPTSLTAVHQFCRRLKPFVLRLQGQDAMFHILQRLLLSGPFSSRKRWNIDLFGDFHGHGDTPIWMVYEGNPTEMDDLGVPPFLETSFRMYPGVNVS